MNIRTEAAGLAGALLAAAILSTPANAQYALNTEFTVNQVGVTDGSQSVLRIATHAPNRIIELTNGNRIVAFSDGGGNDGGSTGMFATILGADDSIVTSVNISNAATADRLGGIAALTTGGFVAVYSRADPDADCYGRVFDNAGSEIVAEFRLHADDGDSQLYCDVAPLAGGDFIAVWDNQTSDDILAQRFNGDGSMDGGLIAVEVGATYNGGASAYTSDEPIVTPLTSGGYAIAWRETSGADTSSQGVFMRAYDAAGTETTPGITRVNTTVASLQFRHSGAGLSNDNIVYVYYDSNAGDVSARILTPAGAEAVAEFDVTTAFNDFPTVAALPGGGFLVTTSDSSGVDGDGWGIVLSTFNNDGTANGPIQIVNTTTAGIQAYSAVGTFAGDSFLIAYTEHSNAVDGSVLSVLARSFTAVDPASAPLVALDAASPFSGQTMASEIGGTLDGNAILDFGLHDRFIGLGAAGIVEAEFTLTNATFSGIVSGAAWTQASDPDCDFGSPVFGGGIGGNVVRFENTGQLNQCSGNGAINGTITLPIEVTNNGDPVSVTVTFTPTADAGAYTGSSDDLDLLAFAAAFDFSITAGAAGAGEFDANGDDLQGTGLVGTLTLADFPADIEADIGVPLADASDIAMSGELAVTFPGGVTGIDETNVDLGGVACTQGAAPSDNVFTCALGGGDLDGIDNGAAGLDITIDDDANAATFVTAQAPNAVLTVTGNPNNTVSGASGGLAEIELDDGLDVNAITSSNFDWVRFGSGGTESNFRIALPSAAEAQAVTQVQVTVIQGNGVAAGTINLLPGAAGTGFQVKGATVTFNSRALGAMSGETGNANITSVALQHDETALLSGTVPGLTILRQLVNRSPDSFIATGGMTND